MYQIKLRFGYELHVIRGRIGRVVNSIGAVKFEGPLSLARAWLSARGIN